MLDAWKFGCLRPSTGSFQSLLVQERAAGMRRVRTGRRRAAQRLEARDSSRRHARATGYRISSRPVPRAGIPRPSETAGDIAEGIPMSARRSGWLQRFAHRCTRRSVLVRCLLLAPRGRRGQHDVRDLGGFVRNMSCTTISSVSDQCLRASGPRPMHRVLADDVQRDLPCSIASSISVTCRPAPGIGAPQARSNFCGTGLDVLAAGQLVR